MECSQPGALREEDFLAYLAGESVRPVVEQHLATCRYCAARLESYRRIELTLTSTLYRWDCPPSHVLGEYQLGLLSGDVATAVRLHVGMCVHCAAELETLSAFLANDPLLVGHTSAEQLAANAPTLDTAAPANHHHSGARQTLEHLRERAAASARRIVATLLPPQPRFAYQREIVQSTAQWPRRYSAADCEISLHIERDTGRRDALRLIGFVTRKETALESLQGTPVQLSGPANVVHVQYIDDLGNFVFDTLAPATYVLELQFPENTIVIEQLELALAE